MTCRTLGSTLLVIGTLWCALTQAQGSTPAAAQQSASASWPTKAIRVVVPFAPGSFTDTAARTIGAELGAELGHPVVVENRGGAGSTLGTDIVAKAAPDGYTFLVTDNSFAMSAALYEKLPYQPALDIVQVSLLADAPAVLVTRPNLPAKTLKDIVDAARSHPGTLTFGSGGQGSSAHLAVEAFLLQNKIEMLHIPFKGIAAAMVDVSADRVDLAIGSVGSTSAYIRDGRLRGVAVSGDTRQAALPDVPTFAQAGFAEFNMLYWFGMMAPAGTPRAILDRMQQAIARAVNAEKVQTVFSGAGVRATASTPAAFTKIVVDETALWTDVIRRARIKIE